MNSDTLALLPYMLLAGGGILIFGAGSLWRRLPPDVLFFLALLTSVAAGLAALWPQEKTVAFSGMILVGGYARFFTVILALITAFTVLFVRQYAKTRGFAGDEFYGLLLLAAPGMMLVAGAGDWVIFFLGLELLSLSLYVLIAIEKEKAAGIEAGLKYFIMGAAASAFLTFGIALLYAATGTLKIGPSLAVAVSPPELPWLLAGLAFLTVGIGFKISMVPFHLWTPDVYQGAPAPVTAFLSTGSKIALFIAVARFAFLLGEPAWSYCQPVVWALAALTMAVGNITALCQTRVKRLLAYSSIGQIGYLLMALTAVKQGSLEAIIFFLAVYAVMDLGAFGLVGALSGEKKDLDDLEEFQGLGYARPWSAAVLAGCLLSLAGLPPTAGFMGKFVLFRAVLQGHYVVLAVIGILTAGISIFFYMKVLVALYMQPAGEIPGPRADLAVRVAGAAILILLLWLGIMPAPLLSLISRTAGALAFN